MVVISAATPSLLLFERALFYQQTLRLLPSLPGCSQRNGVGAKIAYCRDDCVLLGRLQPNDRLVAVDGYKVTKVFTSEVRAAVVPILRLDHTPPSPSFAEAVSMWAGNGTHFAVGVWLLTVRSSTCCHVTPRAMRPSEHWSLSGEPLGSCTSPSSLSHHRSTATVHTTISCASFCPLQRCSCIS